MYHDLFRTLRHGDCRALLNNNRSDGRRCSDANSQGLGRQVAYHQSRKRSFVDIMKEIVRSSDAATVLGQDEVQLVQANAFYDPQLADGNSAGRLWDGLA